LFRGDLVKRETGSTLYTRDRLHADTKIAIRPWWSFMTKASIVMAVLAAATATAAANESEAVEAPLHRDVVRKALTFKPGLEFDDGASEWALAGGAAPVPAIVEEGRAVLTIPAGGKATRTLRVPRGGVFKAGKRYLVTVSVKQDSPDGKATLGLASGGGSHTAAAKTAGTWEELSAFADTATWYPGNDTDALSLSLVVTGSGRALFDRVRVYEIPNYGIFFRFKVLEPAKGRFHASASIIRRHREKNHPDSVRHYFHADVNTLGGKGGVATGSYSEWVDLRRYLFGQGSATVGLCVYPVGKRDSPVPVRVVLELAYHVDDGKPPARDEAREPQLGGPNDEIDLGAIANAGAEETAHVFFRTERKTGNGVLGFLMPENDVPPDRFLSAVKFLEDDVERRYQWAVAALDDPVSVAPAAERILTGANLFPVSDFVSAESAQREAEILTRIGIRACAAPEFKRARLKLYGHDAPVEFVYNRLENEESGLSPYDVDALASRLDGKYRAFGASLLAKGVAGQTPTYYVELMDEPGNLGTGTVDQPAFRESLKRQGITPAMVGATNWESVTTFGFVPASSHALALPDAPGLTLAGGEGADVVAQLEAPDETEADLPEPAQKEASSARTLPLEQRRRLYLTRVFAAQKTADLFATATRAVKKHIPGARTLVNFRSGVRRVLTSETADWFTFGRQQAVDVMWNEDWLNTYGWRRDGIQSVGYYTELMRTAARKHNLPVGGFLMCYWGDAELKAYSALAHGSRFIHFWRYGPGYANYLPYSWSGSSNTVVEIARFCRDVARLESTLADAQREPAKVALLYAKSDPVWGRGQTEHRMLFFALLHAQIPVDLITEADVEEDGLLDRYEYLYIGDVSVRHAALEKTADWVRRGGRLWLSAKAATRDEFDEPTDAITRPLGLEQEELTDQSKTLPTPPDEPEAMANHVLTIRANGARVTASFKDGAPAQIVKEVGKGMICVNAFQPGMLYLGTVIRERGKLQHGWSSARRQWITGFALENGLRRPVEADVPCVEAILYRHPKEDMLMLVNYTGDGPVPTVGVTIRCAAKVTVVESLRNGSLPFEQRGDEVRCSMPLLKGDTVLLRHDGSGRGDEAR
jgi:hypothetical protein